VLGVGGIVYAAQTGYVSLSCAVFAAVPMLVVAIASFVLRADAAALFVPAGIFVLVVWLLMCAAPTVANRESVRDLLKLADARGYASVPVIAQRNDDRSPQFYAHDRVVYNDEGEVIPFDEVTVDKAKALGGKLVVLIPVEYVDHFRNARGIEVIGDNGRTAILGWTPP